MKKGTKVRIALVDRSFPLRAFVRSAQDKFARQDLTAYLHCAAEHDPSMLIFGPVTRRRCVLERFTKILDVASAPEVL